MGTLEFLRRNCKIIYKFNIRFCTTVYRWHFISRILPVITYELHQSLFSSDADIPNSWKASNSFVSLSVGYHQTTASYRRHAAGGGDGVTNNNRHTQTADAATRSVRPKQNTSEL